MFDFRNDYVDCVVNIAGRQVRVSGNVRDPSEFSKMVIMAPNPIDRRMSYTGSGLPFPCPNMAFENTPNYKVIDTSGGFDVVFSYPNSYYTSDTNHRVVPSVFFTLERPGQEAINVRIGLEDSLPLKTLTHRPGRDDIPYFYGREHILPPQSAEGVMRSLAYAKQAFNIG